MKYRRLGRTGLKVSVIGVGTWQLGGEWGKNFTPEEVGAMLGRAGELGINLIDTAECYGDHLAEQLIGQAIQGQRDRWIVATKFGHRYTGHLLRDDLFEADQVIQQLHDSLRALRTDYVDIYQFHSGNDEHFTMPGLWEALQKEREAGRIRHLGLSISGKRENLHQVEAAPGIGADVIQLLYNRIERQTEANVLPACARLDLGVLCRVPLASGYLSGKYKPGMTFGEGDVRHDYSHEQSQRRLQEVQQIQRDEVPEGVPMAQWALAWCLQNPAVAAVIPGCKNIDQVESNAAAADLPMVRDDHRLTWRE